MDRDGFSLLAMGFTGDRDGFSLLARRRPRSSPRHAPPSIRHNRRELRKSPTAGVIRPTLRHDRKVSGHDEKKMPNNTIYRSTLLTVVF
jgi:hypothetical protein